MTLNTLLPTKNKFFVRCNGSYAVFYLTVDLQMKMLLECDDLAVANTIATALNTSLPRSHTEVQQELTHWIDVASRDDLWLNAYTIGIIRALLWVNGVQPLLALEQAEIIATTAKAAVQK